MTTQRLVLYPLCTILILFQTVMIPAQVSPHSLIEASGDSILSVSLTALPQSGQAVQPVLLSAEATGGSGQGYSYLWDFDQSDGIQTDGIGQSLVFPFGKSPRPTVTVRAWDNLGNYGWATADIEIADRAFTLSSPIDLRNFTYPAENPLIIEGVEITSNDSTGIYLFNVKNVIIRDNWLHDCTAEYGAIFIDACSNIIVEENLMTDNKRAIYGIGDTITIRNNIIKRTSANQIANAAVSIGGAGVTGILVEQNYISETGPLDDYVIPKDWIDVNLPIGIGGSDCIIRNNYIFNSMGSLMVYGGGDDQFYAENIIIEKNIVRNDFPWVEPGIAIWAVKNALIASNYVDMEWRETIRSYACRNIEIANNLSLGHLNLVDSDHTSIHHNSIIFDPTDSLELWDHIAPPGIDGILVNNCWPGELAQTEGDPGHSEDVLIADNLISGVNNGIQAADCIDLRADWNIIRYHEPVTDDENRDYYLRVFEMEGNAIVGKNNKIANISFIDPDAGNFYLLADESSRYADHAGQTVGAVITDQIPTPPEKSMFSFGIQSSEKLGNTGAENGIIHPWTMASSEVADAQLNTVETAQFNGSTVLPYSGNKFFLLDGSVTVKDGWGMASAYHQLYPLDSNTDLIDNGSVIFRLAGYLWLREDSCQVNVVPGIEFFDGNNQILYSATGQGSDFWKPNGGYNPMTFYGQVPPQARNFSVRIRVNFMEPEGTYPFALALDDISLTLYTDTESGIRPFVYVAEEFQLWQNSPNPFNSNTLIKYRLPASVAVRIEIFNALGQHVDTICDDFQGSGIHTVEWNADPLSSGIYFYVISADDFVKSRKCLLLK